jgi:dihydrofolate reductase
MSKVRVHNFAMSLDGYVAGPNQSLDNPLGVGGTRLHEWVFKTRGGRQMMSDLNMLGDAAGGDEGIDNDFWIRGDDGIGATIMGRNMFGPIRGEWPDDSWTGWWGANPPYHHPVFVLTSHPRSPITMEGGTTFNFVTDGIHAALERAIEAANGADVRIGGGASTVQQYLRDRLIDDLHVVMTPTLLGGGERLFDNLDGGPEGYECVELVSSAEVVHIRLAKTAA